MQLTEETYRPIETAIPIRHSPKSSRETGLISKNLLAFILGDDGLDWQVANAPFCHTTPFWDLAKTINS
jgi:hypothetical protein